MDEPRGTVRPIWALTFSAIALIGLVSVGAGWLVAGRATAAVVVAVLTGIVIACAVIRLLVGCGIISVRVAAPAWLRRWERTFDVAPRHAPEVERALTLAAEEARHFCQQEIGSEHLLLGLMRANGDAARALERQGVALEALIRAVDRIAGVGAHVDGGMPALSSAARSVIDAAEQRAIERRARTLSGTELLAAIAAHPHYAGGAVLETFGCTPATLSGGAGRRRPGGR